MTSIAIKNNKIYSIKNSSGLFCINHRYKNYIIGFHSRILAYRVKDNLPPNPHKYIYLKPDRIEEVSADINFGLKNMGLEDGSFVTDVNIDLQAELSIPKNKNNIIVEDPYYIEDLRFDEFLMYPFQKCLGVIMPFEIYREDEDRYIFLSQVIDPCENTLGLFRKSLENQME
jgi:hypothetical protein